MNAMRSCARGCVLVLGALVLVACGEGGFPNCNGIDCAPCLECDSLIGSYSGWMTDFENDCLEGIDPGMEDQPWGLIIDAIEHDAAGERTHVEIDMTEQGYGVVEAAVCAPQEAEGERRYEFCMSFEFDSMLTTKPNRQTVAGTFIEGATGPIRFEGRIHNLMRDPINEKCHVKARILAEAEQDQQ